MSFQITVAVKAGHVTPGISGEVPDGEFIVSGHEDASQRSLSVVRRGVDGRYVQQASAVHHKEQ